MSYKGFVKSNDNESRGKYPLNFFKILIHLFTLANLSLRYSLKLSFLSSLSPNNLSSYTFPIRFSIKSDSLNLSLRKLTFD